MKITGNADQDLRIRRAAHDDIDAIMRLYDIARQTMRDNGNTAQWVNGYPSRGLIASDIERQASYVVEGDDGDIHAVFMFAIGEDETYRVIEGGAWLNDEPYGVIHRVASDGQIRGVLPAAAQFGLRYIDNLRIDTHEDNIIMRRTLDKAGFERCGTIICADGTPRIAFHLRAR